MGNSASIFSKKKVVEIEVRKLDKDKQVIIDTNNDLELVLDENIESKLHVKVSGVRDVIGNKTIYDQYRPTKGYYSVYACVDSGEMKEMINDYYSSQEEVSITLDKLIGGVSLMIEIYRHHNPVLDIGTSDGVMIFGRCRVPIPKICNTKFRDHYEVVNMIEDDLRVIGKIEVEVEMKWEKKFAKQVEVERKWQKKFAKQQEDDKKWEKKFAKRLVNRTRHPGMYYKPGIYYPVLPPTPPSNDHNNDEVHAHYPCNDIKTCASSPMASRVCTFFSPFLFATGISIDTL